MKKFSSLFIIFFLSLNSFGQINDSLLHKNLKKHISVLSHDSLEGRGTSKKGEEKAAKYIIQCFQNAGIKGIIPGNDYIQKFSYESRKIVGSGNQASMIRNGLTTPLKIYKDYWPLSQSSSGIAFSKAVYVGYGIQDSSLYQTDYDGKKSLEGKIFIMQSGNPDGINPHSHFNKYDISWRVIEARKRGASAVVFVNADQRTGPLDTALSLKIAQLDIPVIFLKDVQFEKGICKEGTTLFIQTEIQIIKSEGMNIVAGIDRGKENWVIIGAHYDHLGFGEDGHSLHAGVKNEIHNGADDNASGTAALIEIAKLTHQHPALQNYNLAYLAFSGEELGLLGSANFIKNAPFNIHRTNYMLNMDMIGRLDEARSTLAVNGTGTSPLWKYIDSLPQYGMIISKSESGMGPSDHASFYKEGIPVLHFFTGNHADYHKPTDDEKLINYQGEIKIIKYMINLMQMMDTMPRLEFRKTVDTDPNNSPRFKVSLGIMPDYLYTGQGIKADGTTEGKPAAKAGLKKGDIIIRLGNFPTPDMKAYTGALSNFSKGMKTTVYYLRDGKEMNVEVTF